MPYIGFSAPLARQPASRLSRAQRIARGVREGVYARRTKPGHTQEPIPQPAPLAQPHEPKSAATEAPPGIGLRSLHRVALRVTDLARSADFYRRLTQTEPTLCVRGAIFRLPGFTLHLVGPAWPPPSTDPPNQQAVGSGRPSGGGRVGAGSVWLSFEVPGLPDAYRRLRDLGVHFEGPWFELNEPDQETNLSLGTRIAHLFGPDGESLELIEPAGPFLRDAPPDRGAVENSHTAP